MNFPPFWAKGTCKNLSCWRWSSTSLAEARTRAMEAAQKLSALFESGESFDGGYGYRSDRPLREPVLSDFKDPSGQTAAVITRNLYGTKILNTARIMFVDVDQPKQPRTGGLNRLLGWIFGRPKPVAKTEITTTELLARAKSVLDTRTGWGWRIYQTKAGFRLVATHQLFDPISPETGAVFEMMGTDPLYRKLCGIQKCFRARLTPKPWRLKIQRPGVEWPWRDSAAEQRFKNWEEKYEAASRSWATCQLITTLGNPQIHPEIQPILATHDKMTQVGTNLPLA